jgi:hypothetical protein
MNPNHDTIAELEALTAEMAETQDLGGKRLNDLLEKRGKLIRCLIASNFDAADCRLVSIIAHADQLQERLQRRAESIRSDLSGLETTRLLMAAVKSTLSAPQPPVGLDISA